MAFNEELAKELLADRDRDHARFFAGRGYEIEQYEAAIRESQLHVDQAVFRVFQGSPGCGKTSLASHLRTNGPPSVLFVRTDTEHLAGTSELWNRIHEAALRESSVVGKTIARTAQTTGSFLRIRDEGRAARNYLAKQFAAKGKVIVLHVDEAQTVSQAEGPVLKALHTIGMDVPVVCMFTGLSTTADSIGKLDGLSRPSDNAIVNMGAMADEECDESTRMMLGKLRVVGTEDERESLAKTATGLSFNWPQHLHCAQMAVCRELLRTDGVMREVDVDAVRNETDQRRGDYYHRRLAGTMLNAAGGTLTAAVVKRTMAMDKPPADEVALADICGEEMRRTGLDTNPNFKSTPSEFASLLLERGVLATGRDGRYGVAIPSMARWLGIPRYDARASGPASSR